MNKPEQEKGNKLESLRTFLISKRKTIAKVISSNDTNLVFLLGGLTSGFFVFKLILAPIRANAAEIFINGMPLEKQPLTLFQYIRSYGSSKSWSEYLVSGKPTKEFNVFIVKPLLYSVKPLACFAAGSLLGGFFSGKLVEKNCIIELDECYETLLKVYKQ